MRTKNSIINIIFSLINQFCVMLAKFLSLKVFVSILGAEVLGINEVFSNILSVLTVAGLAIDTVITVKMYNPLAQKNYSKINTLLAIYQKLYNYLILFIIGASLILLPILSVFINTDATVTVNIYIIFGLFVLSSCSGYLFSAKKSLFNVDQKIFITTIIRTLVIVITNILQVLILLYTKNYYLYLILTICTNILEIIILNYLVKKKYTFFKTNCTQKDNTLETEVKKDFKIMVIHKMSSVFLNSTDAIVISTFLGTNLAGIYSNYFLIISGINNTIIKIFSALVPSIGNLKTENDLPKLYSIFKKVNFATFWMYTFCGVCLVVLLNPFIEFWLNSKDFTLSLLNVILIVLSFFFAGIRTWNLNI